MVCIKIPCPNMYMVTYYPACIVLEWAALRKPQVARSVKPCTHCATKVVGGMYFDLLDVSKIIIWYGNLSDTSLYPNFKYGYLYRFTFFGPLKAIESHCITQWVSLLPPPPPPPHPKKKINHPSQ